MDDKWLSARYYNIDTMTELIQFQKQACIDAINEKRTELDALILDRERLEWLEQEWIKLMAKKSE